MTEGGRGGFRLRFGGGTLKAVAGAAGGGAGLFRAVLNPVQGKPGAAHGGGGFHDFGRSPAHAVSEGVAVGKRIESGAGGVPGGAGGGFGGDKPGVFRFRTLYSGGAGFGGDGAVLAGGGGIHGEITIGRQPHRMQAETCGSLQRVFLGGADGVQAAP